LNGKPPTPSELFCHTHQWKDKTWVDQRSTHVDVSHINVI